MGNPVVHFEVIGKDARALQNFYGAIFDWEIGAPQPHLNEYALVQPRGGGIGGGIGTGMDDYAGHVTFYVEVPNLEAALEKIHALGGRTLVPPDAIPAGPRIALFADPEGHVVGLVQAGTGM
jgi:predicted enzyme related to lactoylglutathione lyase